MKRSPLCIIAVFVAALTTQSCTAADETAKGKIVRFECGDNCYLVIQPESGEELTGLCTAETCNPWNEVAGLPAELIGRNVVVTLGKGKQYDGTGNEMGETTSFTKVVIAKKSIAQ